MYFYPRPPRGGRRPWGPAAFRSSRFLSTPSARRATRPRQYLPPRSPYFYPRPPRGGRPRLPISLYLSMVISIHALREEGDEGYAQVLLPQNLFLSTPSARRATRTIVSPSMPAKISIHALREEGDVHKGHSRRSLSISIHALREEGDPGGDHPRPVHHHFYPRPPRGGRLEGFDFFGLAAKISIHALREEGDRWRAASRSCPC